MSNMEQEKEKAFKDWQKDFNWYDYEIAHNDGFDAGVKVGVKAERERIKNALTDLGYTYGRDLIYTTLFPQEPQQEGER